MAYKIKTTATNGKAPIKTTHSSRSNTSPFKQRDLSIMEGDAPKREPDRGMREPWPKPERGKRGVIRDPEESPRSKDMMMRDPQTREMKKQERMSPERPERLSGIKGWEERPTEQQDRMDELNRERMRKKQRDTSEGKIEKSPMTGGLSTEKREKTTKTPKDTWQTKVDDKRKSGIGYRTVEGGIIFDDGEFLRD